jgi:Zn-dependent alcohol dehydrogenase
VKTRAAVHLNYGEPLIIDEIDLPDPGPSQVIVSQYASGVCHSQLHQLHNPDMRRPLVIGHESTGVVVATGDAVTHVKEGDRVMVTWVRRSLVDGLPPTAPTKLTFRGLPVNLGVGGTLGVFTWAESTIVDEQFIVKLPDGVATDVTAIIGCAVMTGCGAVLNSAAVRPNDSVAVVGVGGVGLCIVQAAANVGAYPIIAVDLQDEKLEFATKFGATIGVNAAKEDAVARIQAITSGGADFAFDAIGVARTTEQILAAIRPGVTGLCDGGTAVLVGVPHGAPPSLNMRDIFGGKIFRGAPGGTSRPDRDFPMYVRWFKEGKLPLDLLVSRRFKLEQINEACAALERGEIAGRAIIEFAAGG